MDSGQFADKTKKTDTDMLSQVPTMKDHSSADLLDKKILEEANSLPTNYPRLIE